jgi:hypothetical protein
MSRPQTPLKVLEARGSIKKNPQRYRLRLEKAAAKLVKQDIGPPPEHWAPPTPDGGNQRFVRYRAIWEEFVPYIQGGGTVKRALLELFCEQMNTFRTNPFSMKASEKSYLLQLIKALGIEQGAANGAKKPEGYGGQWEVFG